MKNLKSFFDGEVVQLLLIGIMAISFLYSISIAVKESDKPEFQQQSYCRSKNAGSRPSCWNQNDWDAYCNHVNCKN